jgi:hypothetical protein
LHVFKMYCPCSFHPLWTSALFSLSRGVRRRSVGQQGDFCVLPLPFRAAVATTRSRFRPRPRRVCRPRACSPLALWPPSRLGPLQVGSIPRPLLAHMFLLRLVPRPAQTVAYTIDSSPMALVLLPLQLTLATRCCMHTRPPGAPFCQLAQQILVCCCPSSLLPLPSPRPPHPPGRAQLLTSPALSTPRS